MTKRQLWSYEITQRPKVRIGERGDRDGIYVYWWNPDRGANGIRDKIRWPLSVRRADGRLDRELVKEAEAELERIHRQLLRGMDPRELRAIDEAQARSANDPLTLSIEEGFRLFFDPADGAYAADTRDVKDLKRYRTLIELVLGPRTTWASLDASAGTALSRGLAQHYPGQKGFRSAARTVDLFFRAADWLRALKRIPVDACLRPNDWAATMRREWRDLGKKVDASKPRYSVEQLQTFLTNLEKADPRIRRAFLIGPEYRAVNIRRVMRSHVDLDQVGSWGLGRIRLPGSGKKLGAVVDIDPALRERLDEDLATGDLAKLEARLQRGEIADYGLFPGKGLKPIGRRHFRDLFEAYESDCEIEHQQGLGWHGLRRALADAMDETTEDRNVRNQAGAWALGSDTRDREYRGVDARLIAKARQAQIATRGRIMGADPELEELRQRAHVLLDDAGREHVEAVLETLLTPKLTPRLTPQQEAESA